MSEELSKQKETLTIEEAKQAVMKKLAEKRAVKEKKAADRAAWLKEYHEQLAKGNSNAGGGAKKARRNRVRKMDPSRFQKPGG